jgi:hypothetical protein
MSSLSPLMKAHDDRVGDIGARQLPYVGSDWRRITETTDYGDVNGTFSAMDKSYDRNDRTPLCLLHRLGGRSFLCALVEHLGRQRRAEKVTLRITQQILPRASIATTSSLLNIIARPVHI